ncbi:hypothetical protein B0T24DRAFT_613663 [Lasiosphaeria ovina]|uniref:Uncharacterized protein n=1 Tax=Lasiosphaeria ovina TaxID=92902 RepID=A0AAE0TTH0_9PEZI|nr:hypothetical protein B0T24DRAFT_613663 [Lasiosphaeria ovina]
MSLVIFPLMMTIVYPFNDARWLSHPSALQHSFWGVMTSCGVIFRGVIWLLCSSFPCTVLMHGRLGPVMVLS